MLPPLVRDLSNRLEKFRVNAMKCFDEALVLRLLEAQLGNLFPVFLPIELEK